MNNHNSYHLSLYYRKLCPYCIVTRRAIKRMNIDIELRSINKEEKYRQELIREGGKIQVPCLRIEKDGSTQWLYESLDIIKYLQDLNSG